MAFFAIVLGLYSLPFGWTTKKVFLLLASYLFYSAWNPPFVILLWISTIVDWVAAQQLVKAQHQWLRRLWMLISVVVNLGMLGYFKYGEFLLKSFAGIMAQFGVHYAPPHYDIILPVGISFYTFATLSYTLDVYLKRAAPARNFLDYALFVTFFPHLVAGPLTRPTELVPQFAQPRRASANRLAFGLSLMILGLFQKVVLADGFLSPVVEKVYDATKAPMALDAWIGTLAFSGQIFCDFAGYFDHSDRRRLVPRLRHARQFPLSLRRGRFFRFLAPLAHHLVVLAARLSLYPAWWKPEGRGANLSGADVDDAVGRAMARRQLDLRRLGRPAWHLSGRRARAAPQAHLAARADCAGGAGVADLPAHQHRLGLLPGQGLRQGLVDPGRHVRNE